ncbi:hypothetical protein A8938_4063 [Algoriphagus zhangzhouensis]|uniref:Uncharacterized protein n=1 Tax=Algoriphagus zhangzhouensis TaxID=1073327 RepID=A0A1M7ZKJ6_9BACT|nr:hypothetical protein A8938_4063 [Algoriphagus zhangzhouensis]SHO65397.1 hypothetical protein SAMN04488108_4058 [Algoriphagus zhangzhouensis]
MNDEFRMLKYEGRNTIRKLGTLDLVLWTTFLFLKLFTTEAQRTLSFHGDFF